MPQKSSPASPTDELGLAAGILLTVADKPWFLIAAVIAYVVAFGRIGCMTH